MPVELTIEQHNFAEVRARLKAAGDKGLTRELNKALKASATEIKAAEQTAARALPAAGAVHTGLRQSISDAMAIRVTDSKSNPGVRVYAQPGKVRGRLGAKTNKPGGWRHPVFGNRGTWVTQVMSPGWWQSAGRPGLAAAKVKVKAALDETVRKIAHG